MTDEDKSKKPEPSQNKHPAADFYQERKAEMDLRTPKVRAMIYTPPPYEHPAAAFYREHAAEMARRRPFLPKMISVPDPHPRDPTMDPPQTITYIDPNQ